MSHKPYYPEPPVPEGAAPFTTSSIEVSKIPLDVFLRANDGRKLLVKCRQRKFLLQTLASYADPDGTSCYPSRKTLLDETKFSEGTLDVYLRDIESDELKFVVKGGYAWEDGPRVRRLVMPVVRGRRKSPSRNSGFKFQELSIQRQEFRIHGAGTQSRLSSTRQYLDSPEVDPP
jgi:hypothetical protein